MLTKWRLKQNRGWSVPLLLSSGIPSVGWDRLVETSWDGVLLHYSWDGDIVRELLKYAEKGKLHPAEKVLKRAYVQESSPFDAHRKEDRVRLQAQSLGLLWFCGTVVEELARSAWQLKDSIRGNHQYKRRECGDSG